jgi:hypothetical protein
MLEQYSVFFKAITLPLQIGCFVMRMYDCHSIKDGVMICQLVCVKGNHLDLCNSLVSALLL